MSHYKCSYLQRLLQSTMWGAEELEESSYQACDLCALNVMSTPRQPDNKVEKKDCTQAMPQARCNSSPPL